MHRQDKPLRPVEVKRRRLSAWPRTWCPPAWSCPALMTAGRWKSAKMPARYTDRQTADRGPVARYYRRAEVNITGSCRQRRSESITGAYTHRGAYHERSRPLPGFYRVIVTAVRTAASAVQRRQQVVYNVAGRSFRWHLQVKSVAIAPAWRARSRSYKC